MRYKLASLLNMKVDDPLFDKVAENLPQDEAWDPNDPIEAAYLAAKLKRYKISALKDSIVTSTETHGFEKKSMQSTESEDKSGPSKSGGSDPVKVEIKDYGLLLIDKKALITSGSALTKQLKDGKLLLASIKTIMTNQSEEKKKSPEYTTLQFHLKQVTEAVKNLSEEEEALLYCIEQIENAKKDTEDQMKEKLVKIKKFRDVLKDHQEAFGHVCRKAKSFCESMV